MAHFTPTAMSREGPGLNNVAPSDDVLYPDVIEGLKKIYKEKLLPLESLYKFSDFHSPLLLDSDIEAKPYAPPHAALAWPGGRTAREAPAVQKLAQKAPGKAWFWRARRRGASMGPARRFFLLTRANFFAKHRL